MSHILILVPLALTSLTDADEGAVDSVGEQVPRSTLFARLPLSAAQPRWHDSGRTEQPERLHLIERSGAGSAGRTISQLPAVSLIQMLVNYPVLVTA